MRLYETTLARAHKITRKMKAEEEVSRQSGFDSDRKAFVFFGRTSAYIAFLGRDEDAHTIWPIFSKWVEEEEALKGKEVDK